jgi:hypothetical protein
MGFDQILLVWFYMGFYILLIVDTRSKSGLMMGFFLVLHRVLSWQLLLTMFSILLSGARRLAYIIGLLLSKILLLF